MGIPGIEQPNILKIGEGLRLVKFNGNYNQNFEMALNGHQNIDTMWDYDGDKTPYTLELLGKKYKYLNEVGELYFIEVNKDGKYIPIGDVSFSQKDMPIIIWEKAYRGKGIGTKVIKILINRAREIGYEEIEIEEIYSWNEASRKSFINNGFIPVGKTEIGTSYRLKL